MKRTCCLFVFGSLLAACVGCDGGNMSGARSITVNTGKAPPAAPATKPPIDAPPTTDPMPAATPRPTQAEWLKDVPLDRVKFTGGGPRFDAQICPLLATTQGPGVEWFAKGNVDYDKAGKENLEAAAMSYATAIEKDEDLAEAYYNHGLVCIELERYEETMADLAKLAELNPDLENALGNLCFGVAGALLNFAGSDYDEKRYDDALRHSQAAAILNPNDGYAFMVMGLAYLERGNVANAQANLDRANELGDDSGGVEYGWGRIALVEEKYEDALRWFNLCMEKYQDADTFRQRAKAYQGLGETEKANADLATASKLEAAASEQD